MMNGITWANPEAFWLALLLPVMIFWYVYTHKKNHAELQVSDFEGFEFTGISWKQRFIHVLFVLRLLALLSVIVALARPQSSSSRRDVNIEGIDIVIAQDISGSMLAEDFRPNRLEAAKKEAISFIEGRPGDRIGLVVFSGESFTQCPITTDHNVLLDLFDGIESGMIEDGTALGDGLATALSRLKESKAVSKVVILLTDGISNMGSIDPLSAAEMARLYKIRVYTIGVGTLGKAPYPFKTPFGIQYQNVDVKIDEKLLQEIASSTGGEYFRATNNSKLESIYKKIDAMEKSRIDVLEFRKKYEEFLPLVVLALAFILAEVVLRLTVFRTNP